jgi:hypothetical protein
MVTESRQSEIFFIDSSGASQQAGERLNEIAEVVALEGVLPRDLVCQLKDVEESLADFSQLQVVLEKHLTLENTVLERLAR